MASITVRALDANGDPIYGNGQGAYLSDLEAVAQIVGQRLKLFLGEWCLSLGDGLDLFGLILGTATVRRDINAIQNALVQRISTAPYVTEVLDLSLSFDSVSGTIAFTCSAQTPFGVLTVTNQPGNLAQLGS